MYPPFIMLVEDDLDLGKLLHKALAQQFPRPYTTVLWVKKFQDAQTALLYDTPDMIFLDLRLPDSQEQETLLRMIALAEGIPIIVLSGYSSMDGLAAIASGAEDFVLKGQNCIQDLQIAASKSWARIISKKKD